MTWKMTEMMESYVKDNDGMIFFIMTMFTIVLKLRIALSVHSPSALPQGDAHHQ